MSEVKEMPGVNPAISELMKIYNDELQHGTAEIANMYLKQAQELEKRQMMSASAGERYISDETARLTKKAAELRKGGNESGARQLENLAVTMSASTKKALA